MTTTIHVRHWSREEYERLALAGMFHPEERLELVDGEILKMRPQGSAHATAVTLVENALRVIFGPKYVVRVQMPLALDPDSEPEPDIAVVSGSPRDFRDGHPNSAELVVEVADTTLEFDRGRKAMLYARAGIPEYWILNVRDRQMEVHRQPTEGRLSTPSYQHNVVLNPSQSITPLRSSQHSIPVLDLFP